MNEGNIPKYNKVKQALNKFNPSSMFCKFFKDLVYKTLDTELNAVVAQTYTYLKSFGSTDIDFLKTKLDEYKQTILYKEYLTIDSKKLISDLSINDTAIEEMNLLSKLLLDNGVSDFYDFVSGNDVNILVTSWIRIIKNKVSKMLKKQESIIKEVIEDLSDQIFDESSLLTSEELLNFQKFIEKYKKI